MKEAVFVVLFLFIVLAFTAGFCEIAYDAGFDVAQHDALNHKWWFQKVTTDDGHENYVRLRSPVYR